MKIFKKTFYLSLFTIIILISCQKEMSYEGGNVSLASGTWQFVNNATQYNGNIDSAVIQDIAGTRILTLEGKSLSGEENFRIRLFTTDSFTTRSYTASLIHSDFEYKTSSKTFFKGYVLSGEFTVNVTSIANNRITGTFSGQVEDSTGAPTEITLGIFTSVIDLSSNGNGQGGTTSVGTLGATADSCTPVIISGRFVRGIPLTTANTVQVQVNVTTPGSYFISTNSVSGFNFSNSGTFTTTGIQSLILIGSDTPNVEGAQYFTVSYGTGNCIFKVDVLPLNYFPTTIGSNWAYSLVGGSTSDSVSAQVISYLPTIGGNVFSSIVANDIPPTGAPDTTYYRKSGNNYYVNIDVKDFFAFDNSVSGEFVILNDLVPANTVIRSPDFTGTIAGVPATGYVNVTITAKGVAETIGTFNFTNVIKVKYEYFISLLPTPVFTEERWFAPDIGIIYVNYDNFLIYEIGRYTLL